jgi:hypothetical protein
LPVRIPIPNNACQISPEKSEILGYLAAEGEIKERKRFRRGNDRKGLRLQKEKYAFFTNLNPALVSRFQDNVAIIYNLRPFYDARKKRCTIKRIAIIEDLEKYGKVASAEWSIPREVLKRLPCLRAWLRGFFDGEAHVENDEKWRHRRIVMFSKNLAGLYQIKKALAKFGIKASVYPETHKLVISQFGNLDKYRKCIGFNHQKKNETLRTILDGNRGKLR